MGDGASGLGYRKAGRADVGALVDLRIDFMRLIKDLSPRDEEGWRAELSARFEAGLESGDLVAWICLDGESVVAASGLAYPADRDARAELGLGSGEALVFNMYTLPGYRRRGIAASLLRRTIGEARSRGAAALRLRPTDDGRPLYERLGFVDSGDDMTLRL
jgi:GNAT superfamily N-acetyltransferase